MIFRQIFDSVSSTYTYLIASRSGGEALLIDPVLEKTDQYLRLMEQLDLQLVKVIDTHVHADHVTAMGALRDHTNCVTVMGEQSPVDVVSMRVTDGERVTIEGINLTALYTPGHTPGSCCFLSEKFKLPLLFSGDTLFQRSIGRTDLPGGDPNLIIKSIKNRLLTLHEETNVIPGHGPLTQIYTEKKLNPFIA